MVHAAAATHKFRAFDFSFSLVNPAKTYTFWSGVIGGGFLTMASHGTDQTIVQRLLAAKSERESKIALLASGVIIFFQFALFLVLGVMLYAWHGAPVIHPGQSYDWVFPDFIVTAMPSGVRGMVIAAIFAVAMSNASGSLNSLAASSVVDFQQLRGVSISDDSDPGRFLRLSRWMTLVWGVVLAVLGTFEWGPMLEAGLTIASITFGSLLGLFLLAFLLRRATASGVLIRHVCGACRHALHSLLHAAVVDVVRSGRRCNHFSWRAHWPVYASGSRAEASTMTKGKRFELVRGLGKWTSASIVVGTMIGTGIFLKPAEMAADAGSIFDRVRRMDGGWTSVAVWRAGLCGAGRRAFPRRAASTPICGAVSDPYGAFCSDGCTPSSGGPLRWLRLRRGFFAFARSCFLPSPHPFSRTRLSVPFSQTPYVFVFTWAQPLAVVALVALAFINYLGVRLGGRVQVVLTVIKVASVVAIIILSFTLARPGGAGFHPFLPASYGVATFAGFFGALAASLWAYDGWEDLNLVGSEVADPQRNIPRALILGVLVLQRDLHAVQRGRTLGSAVCSGSAVTACRHRCRRRLLRT